MIFPAVPAYLLGWRGGWRSCSMGAHFKAFVQVTLPRFWFLAQMGQGQLEPRTWARPSLPPTAPTPWWELPTTLPRRWSRPLKFDHELEVERMFLFFRPLAVTLRLKVLFRPAFACLSSVCVFQCQAVRRTAPFQNPPLQPWSWAHHPP